MNALVYSLWIGISLFAETRVAPPVHMLAARPESPRIQVRPEPYPNSGIHFECSREKIKEIEKEMRNYFDELDLSPKLVKVKRSSDGTSLTYTLNTPADETDTLHLDWVKGLDLRPEISSYQKTNGKIVQGAYPSRKEIAAALMQHGRQYVLSGDRCSVEALKEHIGVRQNIAKWGTVALQKWTFPEVWNEQGKLESKESTFNPKYWADDAKGVVVHEAIADPFIGDFEYEIGCLTAAKFVSLQGIMDYYRNVKNDPKMVAHLDKIAKGDPLSDIDPQYEGDNQTKPVREGKYLSRQFNVPGNNWIPGDWGYVRNPDSVSADRPGYEGANIIYLGGGLFTTYYKDAPNARHENNYFYSLPREVTLPHKLQEVFHWRFGITDNWENDPRRKFLTEDQVKEMYLPVERGGLIEDVRDTWKDIKLR